MFMAKPKTPSYQRRAIKNYNAKFEHTSVNFPIGTKERIKAVTDESMNQFLNRLVEAELERLENQ